MTLKEEMGKLWSEDRLSLWKIEEALDKAQATFPKMPNVPPFVIEEVLEIGFREVSHLSEKDAKNKAKEFDTYFRAVFAWAFENLGEANYYQQPQSKTVMQIQRTKQEESP